MKAAWDSGALISKSPICRPPEFESEFEFEAEFESKLESKFALGDDEDEDEPRNPPPLAAAAAAALVSAAGGSIVLEAAATNLLAAARRSAELTAIFGAEAAFLASGAAFWLPFSLHFSRSSKSSRAL